MIAAAAWGASWRRRRALGMIVAPVVGRGLGWPWGLVLFALVRGRLPPGMPAGVAWCAENVTICGAGAASLGSRRPTWRRERLGMALVRAVVLFARGRWLIVGRACVARRKCPVFAPVLFTRALVRACGAVRGRPCAGAENVRFFARGPSCSRAALFGRGRPWAAAISGAGAPKMSGFLAWLRQVRTSLTLLAPELVCFPGFFHHPCSRACSRAGRGLPWRTHDPPKMSTKKEPDPRMGLALVLIWVGFAAGSSPP